ncbi:Multiple organellar RNA editing factor 8, chloroplastic/mitochondrial [Sesamum alatum]|uniref:Multiple organellar RNA editing factor 8, chloroplastic/mitochondrial n=1 Tax=Sesamum alatum TaxID=300844 RepID=A0AAE2CFN5_9LAMI|nr:Multiple organellar RNA editing factor 8, chloroplastic/mitochondrial [Sesamum alatum]
MHHTHNAVPSQKPHISSTAPSTISLGFIKALTMATRYLARSLFTTTKQSLASVLSHSTASSAVLPNSSSFLFRLRPLFAAASASYFRRLVPALSTRGFATRQTTSSLNDPNPNWSNRPPKETILLDGCDFEHWLVVMEKPEGDPTRDEIIDSYIKTLAMVVGSEEEARMKIYSVSTRHYYAFGALVSEELSYKIKELPKVRWVLPDSYLDVKNKDYGGEPFINGQAVPYDPKYHEEWVRNNARANERNRRNDRPRNFDRSRNFERRREGQMNPNAGPNVGGPGPNMGGQPNMTAPPPNAPNAGGMQSNMGQPNYGGGASPNNPGNYPPNNMRGPPNNAPNYQYGHGPNSGGTPYQSGPGPNQSGFAPGMGPGQGQNQSGYAPNMGGGFPPNRGSGPGQASGGFAPNMGYGAGQNQNNYVPNMGPGPNQNYAPNMGPGQGQSQSGYAPGVGGGNPSQSQNVPGRDLPPHQNY